MGEDNFDLEKLLTEKQKRRTEINDAIDKIERGIVRKRGSLAAWFSLIPATYFIGLYVSYQTQGRFPDGSAFIQCLLILYSITVVKDYFFSVLPNSRQNIKTLLQRKYLLQQEFDSLK